MGRLPAKQGRASSDDMPFTLLLATDGDQASPMTTDIVCSDRVTLLAQQALSHASWRRKITSRPLKRLSGTIACAIIYTNAS